MIEPLDILGSLKDISASAADYIRNEIGNVSRGDIEEKELNSLVSYVDKQTEILLVKELGALLPQAGFITEEDTEDITDKDYTWIIDPLDGTTNFLHQVPYFSVSVALQHNRETIAGVVHEVNRDEQFYAVKGNGSFMNDKPIKTTSQTDPSQILVATGFPYSNNYRSEDYFQVLRHFLMKTRGMRRLGSAATDLCYVAVGRLGAYYEAFLNPWDVAAGALIVEEAGGKVTDFHGGNNYLYGKQIVATTPELYSDVMSYLSALK